VLTYDTDANAYVVALDPEQLRAAPAYSKEELADIGDTDERLRDAVYNHYLPLGATPHWW
jgi:hypothetical protein